MNNLTGRIMITISILAGMGILFHLVLNKEMGKVICKEWEAGYQVTLYDKKGNAFYELETPIQPGITELTDTVTEVSVSTGSPAKL